MKFLSLPKDVENRSLTADEQKQYLKIAGTLATTAVLFMGGLTLLVHYDVIRLYPSSASAETLATFADKAEYAFKYQSLLVLFLLFNVLATIYGRVINKAINPLDSEAEARVQKYKFILTNTFEQTVMSVLAQLVYVSFASSACVLKTIPLVNLIFFVGRIGFFWGYPYHRAFGFLSTIVPTMVLIAYDTYKFITYVL